MTRKSRNGKNDVGYGKPPQETRFMPGQSGNPNGRPKDSQNLKSILAEVLAEKIPVKEAGKTRQISKQRAVIMALVLKAMKGDVRAINALITMMLKVLPEEELVEGLAELGADDAAILEAFAERLLVKNDPVGTDDEK